MFMSINNVLKHWRLRQALPLMVLSLFLWHFLVLHYHVFCGERPNSITTENYETSGCCGECTPKPDIETSIENHNEQIPHDHSCNCNADTPQNNGMRFIYQSAQQDDGQFLPLWDASTFLFRDLITAGLAHNADPPVLLPDRAISTHLLILSGVVLRL